MFDWVPCSEADLGICVRNLGFRTSQIFLKTRTVNVAFWWHLKRFGTAGTIFKIRTLNGAFLRHLIRHGTSENMLTSRTLNSAFWRHSKLFGTAVKKIEIKDNKWRILTVFETIWNCIDHFDTRTLSRALLWHILKRYLKLTWKETAHVLTSLRGALSKPRTRNPGGVANKDGIWCIRMLFETIILKSEILKTWAVNGASCRYLIRFFWKK